MDIKKWWDKQDDFEKFAIVCFILLGLGFIAANFIGHYYVCYNLMDFTMDLINNANVSVGCP